MPDNDEVTLEGILKQVQMNHKDDDVKAMLVIVVTDDDEGHVYNSNMKAEVVESIGALLGPTN